MIVSGALDRRQIKLKGYAFKHAVRGKLVTEWGRILGVGGAGGRERDGVA